MSDDVLSIIPTDPYWQPSREAGSRAADVVAELEPRTIGAGVAAGVDVSWHDVVTLVDSGANLERIGCRRCAASIDIGWWAGLLQDRGQTGFDSLMVSVPCCASEASLNELVYEWPCGFAKFQIAVRNPERAWLTEGELNRIGGALGHPVRQIKAHR